MHDMKPIIWKSMKERITWLRNELGEELIDENDPDSGMKYFWKEKKFRMTNMTLSAVRFLRHRKIQIKSTHGIDPIQNGYSNKRSIRQQ